MKTNVERVLDYLWLADPQGATNAQIRDAAGIQPYQQVYIITQELKCKGKIGFKGIDLNKCTPFLARQIRSICLNQKMPTRTLNCGL